MKTKKITLGQFYTSREVAEFMISLSSKSKDSRVLEPGFGEGIFLEELLKKGFNNLSAYDIDPHNYEPVSKKLGDKVKVVSQDFLSTSKEEKFDLIIGNPPYVQWNNIDEKIRSFLKDDPFWKRYSNGEWDILYAFIIWSIEKLNEDGELIFIVPYNWFNSTFGSSLRNYLIDNGIFETIVHFGEFKLFGDCYPNNIIFKYKKSKDPHKLIFVAEFNGKKGKAPQILDYIKKEYEKIDHKEYEKEDGEFKIFTMPQFLPKELWYLATPSEKLEIRKIEISCNNLILKDALDIGVGIVSGYDEAFSINKDELKNFIEPERRFVYPFIKAKDCERYYIDEGSYYVFADEIRDEAELKSYPNICNRLNKSKQQLSERYMANKVKNWWNWATIRNKKLFEKSLKEPKIFVPCIDRSLKSRFSYTNKEYFGSGDVLIIINKEGFKEDLRYILGWLNSRQINRWYRIKGSHTGHRIRYTQSYVSQIPLRRIDWNNPQEVEIYNKIVNHINSILSIKAETKEDETYLDNLFQQLVK